MTVRLRPFRAHELGQVWAARVARGVPSDQNARRRFRRTYERWREGAMADGFLQLAVEADGRLVGDVQARRPKHGLPEGAFELGIDLYDPADRGKGYGRAAVEQLTELLFRDHAAGRVQASTSVDNAAMCRVLERLGYRREGVMRAFWPLPDGSRQDFALYAVTRGDWERRSS